MKQRNSSPRPTGFKTYQVCKVFDVSKATLFRWERVGIIARPQRDWRNWRLYTQRNLAEIEKVIRARKVLV